jgi:DNA-binding IscR family transcriptional regulator
MTTEHALLNLLYQNRGQVVSVTDVCHKLGREVSRQAVSKAARRLAEVVPVEPIRGRVGGYRLGDGDE